jgi:peptidoglycan hydrolase-like protein with peptidoglycan-binding domain
MMRGNDVAELQLRLGALGFDAGRVDGIFGPATLAATRTFQISQGITVDGLAGPETLAALASAPALVNVAPPPRPAEQPAAGVCSSNDDPIAELVLGADAPMPRCLAMSGDHWLRIVNEADPTTVTLGTWSIDLEAGAAVTSPLPVGAYVGPGAHDVAVARYGRSGPDLVIR